MNVTDISWATLTASISTDVILVAGLALYVIYRLYKRQKLTAEENKVIDTVQSVAHFSESLNNNIDKIQKIASD